MKIWEDVSLLITSVAVGAVSGFIVTVNQVKGRLKLADTLISVITSSFLGFLIALAFDGLVPPKLQIFLAAVAGAGGYPFLMFFIRAFKLAIVERLIVDEDRKREVFEDDETPV